MCRNARIQFLCQEGVSLFSIKAFPLGVTCVLSLLPLRQFLEPEPLVAVSSSSLGGSDSSVLLFLPLCWHDLLDPWRLCCFSVLFCSLLHI